jgi:hypothetical protein
MFHEVFNDALIDQGVVEMMVGMLVSVKAELQLNLVLCASTIMSSYRPFIGCSPFRRTISHQITSTSPAALFDRPFHVCRPPEHLLCVSDEKTQKLTFVNPNTFETLTEKPADAIFQFDQCTADEIVKIIHIR